VRNRIQKKRLDPDKETGWTRWELWLDGGCVGELFEHHRWTGTRYGPRRWIAVHNPTRAEFAALFTTPPQKTARAALDLLAAHLQVPAERAPP
jgi:hypothetical protein